MNSRKISVSLLVAANGHLALGALPSQINLTSIPGMSRADAIKALGKPQSTIVHKTKRTPSVLLGYTDHYRREGCSDFRLDYVVSGKLTTMYDVKLFFNKPLSIADALRATHIKMTNIQTEKEPADGSLVIKGVPGLSSGWRLTYWADVSKPHNSHLDFISSIHP